MPLFGNKFSPIKCPKRKKLTFRSETVQLDYNDPIKLTLGNQENIFTNGEWKAVSEGNNDLGKQNEYLQELVKELKEENNILKLKIDILLNMLTEEACEVEKRDQTIFKMEKR